MARGSVLPLEVILLMNKYEIIPHPYSKKHVLFKVTTRIGRVYACASASVESKPNLLTVQYAWKHNRHNFLPYDEGLGKYTL